MTTPPLSSSGGQARYASDAVTLGEATTTLEDHGYVAQFGVAHDRTVMCFTCHQTSDACDVALDDIVRTEGASDPADMTAVVALTCPHCATRGTLVLTYGPEAPAEEAEVLRLLSDRR